MNGGNPAETQKTRNDRVRPLGVRREVHVPPNIGLQDDAPRAARV